MPKNNTSFNVKVETGQEVYGEILTLLRGYSPYELALKDGFVGTEEEWLASLVGEKGEVGDGIEDVVLNDDYTLTIFYTNGDQYTTPHSIRGETGATGNGIKSATLNPDYTLTLLFTDGGSFTTIPIRGSQGERGLQGIQGIQGETGNGISRVKLNPDYTLTIYFTDGTSNTTSPIRGAQGEKGETGNGIKYATMNSDYTLTIKFTDGSEYTTPVLRGAQGIQGMKGDVGNGIDSAVLNSDYTLTLNFTDGTSYTTTSIRGQAGERGKQGVQGEPGNGIAKATLNPDYTLTLSFTDGSSYTTSSIRGMQGIQGIQGANGADGVGIASATMNQDYTLTLHFTDGTHYTTPSLRGATGSKGDKGDTGNGIDHVQFNNDYTLTFYFDDGTQYTTASIRGEKGEKGEKGDSGDSPAITTTKSGKRTTIYADDSPIGTVDDGADGHTPVITATKSGKITTIKADGTIIAEINDGNDGATGATGASGSDGKDGKDGADGFSPTATVSKSGSTATITITDKNGTTTAEVHDGQGGTGTIDPTPTEGSANAVSSGGVYDELSDVKGSLNDLKARTPEMFDSTEVNVDLDISDGDGNVLARFQNGHIKTKNFDSSEIEDEIDSKQDSLTFDSSPTLNSNNPVTSDGIKQALDRIGSGFFMESEETSPDLDITDEYGNVLVRYENGGVETSEFRGFTYKTYRSISAKYSNTDLTLTVNHDFKKGDRIVLHIARGATPWAVGAFVTYKEGTKTIVSNKQVDCVWIEHTVTSNVSQISAVFAADAGIPSGTTVTLEVSLLGDIPIKPTVIKVNQDGSEDYTTIRGALDVIGTKANDVLNPYRIEIYPGTYDVLADYTDAEIQAATYTQTGFVGPKLLNGMYLVGIGRPQDIVLTASLDPNDYSSEIRNAISPLNCQGNCGFENMTIIAENLRYCVHDDFLYCYGKRYKRFVKNCIFRAYGDMAYAPTPATYGAGVKRGGGDFLFQDCDFGSVFGLHTDREMYDQGFIHLVNCKGSQFEMGDIEESNGDGKTIYRIDNCHFEQVYQHYWGSETYVKAHAELIGDSKGLMYNVPTFAIYKTGDVTMCPELSESSGTVVEHCNTSNRPRWTVATSIETARGVVIGNEGTDCYIQVSGCVPTNRVGITGFSLGNYIGVINGVLAIVQNASDAIGKIICVDTNGVGHIELKWR